MGAVIESCKSTVKCCDSDDETGYKKRRYSDYVPSDTEKDYTKEDKILDALGSYTFEVRARKVEELLETIITKMDQTTTPTTKNTISNNIATPNLFPNNAIPESITRLSKG